jgi:lysozyme
MDFNRAIEQLRRDEGEVLHAYQDHLGYWTIGVGRLIDQRKGGGISKEESAHLLNNDIIAKWTELTSKAQWILLLNDARQGALLNMAFQMGVEGLLKFHTTLRHIRAGEWEAAYDAMLSSLWATQTPERAKRIAEQIRDGEWK